jgi:cell division protease FtsH
VKRDARDVWLSSEQRTVHTRGPVMTDGEKAAYSTNGTTGGLPQDEAAVVGNAEAEESAGRDVADRVARAAASDDDGAATDTAPEGGGEERL